MANEVLLRLFSKQDQLEFESASKLRAYLYRSARNLITDEHRRRRARPSEASNLPDDLRDVNADFEARVDDETVLQQLLAQLPQPQREVVELRYLHDLSPGETAQRLGKPLNTVKSLQSRGLRRLQAIALAVFVVLFGLLAAVAYRQFTSADLLQPVNSSEEDPSGVVNLPSTIERSQRSSEGRSDVPSSRSDGIFEIVPAPAEEAPAAPLSPAPATPTSAVTGFPQSTASVPAPATAPLPTTAPQATTGTKPELSTAPASSTTTEQTTPDPTVPTLPAAQPVLLSGTITIRSVATGNYLWARESDNTVRSNGSAATDERTHFRVIQIDSGTIALSAASGARENRIGVQNDSDNTLRTRGGDGQRPWLIAYLIDDGTYRFESGLFPGQYLRVDGATVDSGGSLTSGTETFFVVNQVDD